MCNIKTGSQKLVITSQWFAEVIIHRKSEACNY